MIIDITRINKSGVLKDTCIPDTDLCEGLQGELKAIVTAMCGLAKFEVLENCELVFDSATTQNSLNELIKQYLCTLNLAQVTLINNNNQIFDLCNGDNWDLTSNICLEGNPLGLNNTLQAAIYRIITLTTYVNQLSALIEVQNIKINNILTRIDKIENNCCNVTLVDRIAELEQRLLNANIP